MIGGLKIAIAQINPILGDITHNTSLILNALKQCEGADIVVFPELVICGSPPEDLVLKKSFVLHCMNACEKIISETKSAYILTTPWIENNKTYNAALFVNDGKIQAKIFKNNLPNYGVFDEKRVFESGPLPEPVEFKGHKIGIVICEDIWFAPACAQLKKLGAKIILSPNGSPYSTQKHKMRDEVIRDRIAETGLPIVYVNQLGGQDDLIYDGGSMVWDTKGNKIFQAPHCESFVGMIPSPKSSPSGRGLLTPSPLGEGQGEGEIYACLKLSLHDYITKNGFKSIILGMSGGIDSALSAAIAADAIGAKNIRCVMMPSNFTSKESLEDAKECAAKIGCPYEIISIEHAMKAFEETIPTLSSLAHENMQSRARGLILMSLSNQTGAMVLTTGNKSEMAVGYATLYGDMCGGFNVLKDIYKTKVYDLARYRNTRSPVIPQRILTKAPTAELRPNQTDQDSLPPYDILDAILEGLIERDLGIEELVGERFDRATVIKVFKLLDMAEYKRRQSAPGPKITPRALFRDRRYPITNGYRKTIEK